MSTTTARLTDAHVLGTQKLIGNTWQVLGKRSIFYIGTTVPEPVTKLVLKVVDGSHKAIKEYAKPFFVFQHQDWGGITELCEAVNSELKKCDELKSYRVELSRPMNSGRYSDWSILLLNGNLAYDQVELSSDLGIPPKFEKRGRRDEMTWDFWLRTNTPWYDNWTWEEKCHSVEARVRDQIEHVWRNRLTEPDPHMLNALRWENTTMCALEAVHSTLHRLDEANDLNTFIALCQKLHELMIKHNLWEKDNSKSDRADADGKPLPFEKLSDAMKEHYVLIMLSTLSAIGDYKVAKKVQAASAQAA